MINNVEKGILVLGVLGAHSGNIVNGDFSIGLNPGLYIEKGEIMGRIKQVMVAGNIYDIMKRAASVEDRIHQTHGGSFPAVCFDDVSFSSAAVG
jgi:PmbA protein